MSPLNGLRAHQMAPVQLLKGVSGKSAKHRTVNTPTTEHAINMSRRALCH
jgi:hypothetical protein